MQTFPKEFIYLTNNTWICSLCGITAESPGSERTLSDRGSLVTASTGIGGQGVCNHIWIYLARFWFLPYNSRQCRVSDDLGAKVTIEQTLISLICP